MIEIRPQSPPLRGSSRSDTIIGEFSDSWYRQRQRARSTSILLQTYSHSIVSDDSEPVWVLAFIVLIITLYRHFYRQKISAFANAGDGLDLTGGYSSPSIVNYRRESARRFTWIIRCNRSMATIE